MRGARSAAEYYDIALDFQGLMKSAILARASGARRVAGFSIWHLREKTARPFYSETDRTDGRAPDSAHVIYKNLHLLEVLGLQTTRVDFPLARVPSHALDVVRASLGDTPFALMNPGAAWPNKRWPAERFGEVAGFLREVRGLAPVVLWGPGEEALAQSVVEASAGAAQHGAGHGDCGSRRALQSGIAHRLGRYRSVAHCRRSWDARSGGVRAHRSPQERTLGRP